MAGVEGPCHVVILSHCRATDPDPDGNDRSDSRAAGPCHTARRRSRGQVSLSPSLSLPLLYILLNNDINDKNDSIYETTEGKTRGGEGVMVGVEGPCHAVMLSFCHAAAAVGR